ncbi:multidrug resistance protein [Fusarium avenaceum]|nr:multidrug resistance protein [Fusarium avenaceum]
MLAPYSVDFTRASVAAAKLFELIDRKSAIDPFGAGGERPLETIGEITLKNVTFAYPARPGVTVLDDFSVKFPAGKTTALVGQSGSGKSTVVGLIERWYNIASGAIQLDGRPIDELNLNWLRTNIRIVQQEPVLFQGTIFTNIKHGLTGTPWEHSPMEEQTHHVQEAAKLAFAHDFITKFPNGYDTQIGERGSLLSVLLLDEATSALDPEAERIVQQALDKACEGRTTIIIAHKLATIQKADNIIVMEKGSIVEQGTHQSLIAHGGTYARLVQAQNLAGPENQFEDVSDHSESVGGVETIPIELSTTLTRRETSDQTQADARNESSGYEQHEQRGIVYVIARLISQTPELALVYTIVLMGCILAGGTFPSQAMLLANIMDVFSFTGSEMERQGNFYAKIFIFLACSCFIAYFALGYATNVVAQTLSHKFRKISLQSILRQDLQFFDQAENSTGALTSQIDSNPQAILELMGYNIGLVLVALLNIASCSVLAIAYSWRLGLVVVCGGLPPLVAAGYLKIRLDARLDREMARLQSTSASTASEAISSIRTISSLAIEKSVLGQYAHELDSALAGTKRPVFTMMICFAFTQSIEYWFMALGFWYGCRLLSFDEISMYAFFIAFLGVFFSGQSAAQLFQFSSSITKGINAANYVFWLQDLQPTIRETNENSGNGPGSGNTMNIRDVRFSYPLRPCTSILKGINLHIKKGQFVAFVGSSGCGKSTMIALLERFYDPTTGSIEIDSANLTSLNPRLYRRIIALVQQEPALLQGSIRENIAFGVDEHGDATTSSGTTGPVNDEMIDGALRAANAWDFVSSLPEGLSTPAGSGGTQLSGGQRQRIAIARALIRNPKVLLLDEATSALDTESEKIVQGALSKAAKEGDRMTIAVAHRLSTIKDADVICVFHAGMIKEIGTHQELISRGGIYHKMCEAQALD